MRIYNTATKAGIWLFAFLIIDSSLHAQKRWDAPKIVTMNCSGCHGIDGNAELPYNPRLAGLNATYAEKKLAEFKESPSPPVDEIFHWVMTSLDGKKVTENLTPGERVNMLGMAHDIRPEIIQEAVLWYAKQHPAPGHGRNMALQQQGQEIFDKGVRELQIVACMSCHGQDAQGQAAAPRLAGQNAEYIQAQMDKFRKGDRKHAPEMTMEARELNPEQARAVAAYLQAR